jgi:hypothetical protein
MVPRWLAQVLHPPQKFKRPPFFNAWRYGIKKYGIEVIFSGITSLLNFIKIYQLVQNLLGGTQTDRRTDRQTDRHTDGQTNRQTDRLVIFFTLTFLFKESRLKTEKNCFNTTCEDVCLQERSSAHHTHQVSVSCAVATGNGFCQYIISLV